MQDESSIVHAEAVVDHPHAVIGFCELSGLAMAVHVGSERLDGVVCLILYFEYFGQCKGGFGDESRVFAVCLNRTVMPGRCEVGAACTLQVAQVELGFAAQDTLGIAVDEVG